MTGIQAAMIRAHEENIRRYTRLLYTKLTQLERDFVRRRLEEERREVKRLKGEADAPAPYLAAASQAAAQGRPLHASS